MISTAQTRSAPHSWPTLALQRSAQMQLPYSAYTCHIKMIVSREFVSIGVNRVANSLAWGGGDGDGLIAYGGHNSVVVYDPESAVIEYTLTGHTGLVNTVLWVENGGERHAVQR